MAGRLLVVNDEPETGAALERALALEGFDVILARGEAEALHVVQDTEPDVAIVDLAEPDARGAALCRRLREASPRLPIVMVGVGDTVGERTGGLALGADHYLAKPFALLELLTRVRGLLRRKRHLGSEVLRFADLVLDPAAHAVVRDALPIELTPTEFALLELFMNHPREVLSRALIFEAVWGFDFGSSSNTLNVRIGELRRKLEAGNKPRLIHTVRGVGYVLREP
jgi:two-component system, OmpR family, response regulator MprA